jgi:hypothetical protein
VLSDPEVEALQQEKLARAGWSVTAVRSLAAVPPHARIVATEPTEAEVVDLIDQLLGPDGLAEKQALFTQREVHQRVAAWGVDRLDAPRLHALVQRFLADPRLVRVRLPPKRRRNRDEETYTTGELLAVEDALMALYRQGLVSRGGTPRGHVSAGSAEAAIAAVNDELRTTTGDPWAALSGEQEAAVRALLDSNDLVRPVVGPAGTGKTEAMRALVKAYTSAGYTVVATANGGRQAEELHQRLRIRSEVVTSWLTRLDGTGHPADVWHEGSILILDEATQVSTRHAERLLRHATATGTVVILVGDPAQLGSVGAGGWFRHLTQLATAAGGDVPGLRINQRQTGPAMRTARQALGALRSATPDADRQALTLLARDGRLQVFDEPAHMLAAVIRDWHSERRIASERPPARLSDRSRMMAEGHRETELLNRAARVRLTADGVLTGPPLRIGAREFQAGDEVITLTQAGHTLVPAGAPRSAYIRTGTVGLVTAVHTDPHDPERQGLTVEFPERAEVRVGWDYLTHAFPDGRDGGLAHAYALTAHKAEGSTMATARGVVTDATTRSGLYVMLSRARTDLRAYLIRTRDIDVDLDDETWLPVIRDTDGPARALLDRLARSRTERLAGEYDPIARKAHHLAGRHSLAELTAKRRAAMATPTSPDALVIRRAELASEARIAQQAIHDPAPELVARIGPRPFAGPHRDVWDRCIAADAISRAREPQPDSSSEDGWEACRREAEAIAARWATGLSPILQRRFHTAQEAIPRERAIAGIHALIAAGWTERRITQAVADHVADARAGAPLLAHRVRELLTSQGNDQALYELPPPAPAGQAADLLLKAEARHLATSSTAKLAAEWQLIRLVLAGDNDAPDDVADRYEKARGGCDAQRAEDVRRATAGERTALERLRQRGDLLETALQHQIDEAVTCLDQEPPTYLTDLLGQPPQHPLSAAGWRQHAIRIERYRHHHRGLSYATAGAGAGNSAIEQALGPAPTASPDATIYAELISDLESARALVLFDAPAGP